MHQKNKLTFLLFCFLFVAAQVKAQRIATYGTNTLFEAIDNPSVAVLNKDFKNFAFNFLVPSISGDLRVWGDADSLMRNNILNQGQGIFNASLAKPQHYNIGFSSYAINLISAKYLLNIRTGTELMLDVSSRGYAYGKAKNDAVSSINSDNLHPGSYTDQYITNSYGAAYNQIAVGLHRKFNESIALGVKVGYVSGVNYSDINITRSQMDVLKSSNLPDQNMLYLSLRGKERLLGKTDSINVNHFLPNFKNPGFTATIAMTAKLSETMDASINLRDIGFITWKEFNREKVFDGRRYINGTYAPDFSRKNILDLITFNDTTITKKKITTYLPARLEMGLNNRLMPFWRSAVFVSVPVQNLQSDIAWLNDFNYEQFHFILQGQYNTNNSFTIGTHFTIQAPWIDFMMGSDNLFGTYKLIKDARNTAYRYTSQTSAQFNFGVAFKLGRGFYSENASYIPITDSKSDQKVRKRVQKTKDYENQ
ncbi:DUF5723 family protein [Solitalea koreensis]|uniref:DUF5723 domain-containing protein n=1 Tax=Solitalea koreensis TaxID=543615 RepID=A0A521EC30_9SPHI|nr:DUF5723 family protein [Solitalea koreensis]SMO81439.1 hypothetical protein SAMN06265350_11330 [Solitalea koreensis]